MDFTRVLSHDSAVICIGTLTRMLSLTMFPPRTIHQCGCLHAYSGVHAYMLTCLHAYMPAQLYVDGVCERPYS